MSSLHATKKICFLTDHHISINPRLWKEAFLYERMGFEVVVLTQWVSDYFLEKDGELLQGHRIRYEAYLDMRAGHSNPVTRLFFRLRKRLGGELQKHLKISMPWSVSYAPDLLYRQALKENADFYAAHLEAGFIAGARLINAGRKVGFDLEDWYSRDYLTRERAVQLLHETEGFALKRGKFFTTTSESMAGAISATWNSNMPITVVYNSFPDEGIPTATTAGQTPDVEGPLRILWTSRNIGPGRGIETLVKALQFLDLPVELHLIGQLTEGYDRFLQEHWPDKHGHRLMLVDFMSHHELTRKIPSFDLGLAVENNFPDNKDLTISNKILQYLHAGIKVLATETKGQMEVAKDFPGSVFLVPVNDPQAWADSLRQAIRSRGEKLQSAQRKTYNEKFSWPVQEEKLKQLITAHI